MTAYGCAVDPGNVSASTSTEGDSRNDHYETRLRTDPVIFTVTPLVVLMAQEEG